jgi:hypothetical protein
VSDELEAALAALAAGEYDGAGAAALVSLAASAERLAQTAADLVDGFARYLVLEGCDQPSMVNGSGVVGPGVPRVGSGEVGAQASLSGAKRSAGWEEGGAMAKPISRRGEAGCQVSVRPGVLGVCTLPTSPWRAWRR